MHAKSRTERALDTFMPVAVKQPAWLQAVQECSCKQKPAHGILEQELAIVLRLGKLRGRQCCCTASAGCLLSASFCIKFSNSSQNHVRSILTWAGIYVSVHLEVEFVYILYPLKANTTSSSALAEIAWYNIKQYLRIYWVFKISVLFHFSLEETPLWLLKYKNY